MLNVAKRLELLGTDRNPVLRRGVVRQSRGVGENVLLHLERVDALLVPAAAATTAALTPIVSGRRRHLDQDHLRLANAGAAQHVAVPRLGVYRDDVIRLQVQPGKVECRAGGELMRLQLGELDRLLLRRFTNFSIEQFQ